MIPKSSCADLIRVSTPLIRLLEAVDGRAEPGQDEVIRPISSLVRPQNFLRTALRGAGEGLIGREFYRWHERLPDYWPKVSKRTTWTRSIAFRARAMSG